MNGYIKFDKYVIGWLNPYFTRTVDGDSDFGCYWKMSETTINEKIKDLGELKWADVETLQ
jgi:hypothetical protein